MPRQGASAKSGVQYRYFKKLGVRVPLVSPKITPHARSHVSDRCSIPVCPTQLLTVVRGVNQSGRWFITRTSHGRVKIDRLFLLGRWSCAKSAVVRWKIWCHHRTSVWLRLSLAAPTGPRVTDHVHGPVLLCNWCLLLVEADRAYRTSTHLLFKVTTWHILFHDLYFFWVYMPRRWMLVWPSS